MEDGDPIHRSRYHDDWRQAHGIKKIMKEKDEMIQIIQEVWAQVSQKQLQTLISIFLAKMDTVTEANGESTQW